MSGRVPAAAAETSFWWATSQPTGVTFTVMCGFASSYTLATSASFSPSAPMAHTVSVCFLSAATPAPPELPHAVIPAAIVRATATEAVLAVGCMDGSSLSAPMYALPVSAYITLLQAFREPQEGLWSHSCNMWDIRKPCLRRLGGLFALRKWLSRFRLR